jgi:hypothetical protein
MVVLTLAKQSLVAIIPTAKDRPSCYALLTWGVARRILKITKGDHLQRWGCSITIKDTEESGVFGHRVDLCYNQPRVTSIDGGLRLFLSFDGDPRSPSFRLIPKQEHAM